MANSSQPILINKGINIVYKFQRDEAFYYLKISHDSIRSKKELTAALDFQQYLYTNKVRVPEILKSKKGYLIEEIIQEGRVFLAHVIREVPGTKIKMEEMTPTNFESWGEELAKFHRVSSLYSQSSEEPLFANFEKMVEEFDEYAKKEKDKLIKENYEYLKEKIFHFSTDKDNYGIIHGDHRDDNVIFDKNKNHISFIDFDEPLYRSFAADIVRPFFDWYVEGNPKFISGLSSFVKGYRKLNTHIDLRQEILMTYLQWKAFDIYLWTLNNWEEEIAPNGKSVEDWMIPIKKLLTQHKWTSLLKGDF
jgi:Ser/Thr protein kinase RdoA (MazF antagonist)